MVAAMLMVVREERFDGLGTYQFAYLPRLGEHVMMNDSEGVGQAYRVVDVHHNASNEHANVDLYVEHVGTTLDHYKKLRLGDFGTGAVTTSWRPKKKI